MKTYTSQEAFDLYLRGKREMVEIFKDQFEFHLKHGTNSDKDLYRLIGLCDELLEINKPKEL